MFIDHKYIEFLAYSHPLRSQVPDRQRSDEELWHHLLQRGLLPDVWLQQGGDHAAALHLSIPGGARHHEDRLGPTDTGPVGLRGAQGGDPLLR